MKYFYLFWGIFYVPYMAFFEASLLAHLSIFFLMSFLAASIHLRLGKEPEDFLNISEGDKSYPYSSTVRVPEWLDLRDSHVTPITSLGNLKSVGGYLDLRSVTPIASLGSLKSVGENLCPRSINLSDYPYLRPRYGCTDSKEKQHDKQ